MAFLNPRIRNWRDKRVWLIGASSGIGAALAERLAAAGARVAISARREARLHAVAARCGGARVLPIDVTECGRLASAWDELRAEWGSADLVVFCVGTFHPRRSWEMTAESARATLTVNQLAVFDGVSAVLPSMLEAGSGGLVLVASVAGYGGLPQAVEYGPCKAALINLAEILYLDLAPRGLGVWLVDPGFVDTPLTAGNDFPMPALISADAAADEIVAGLASGEFEIHFPKRFTRVLKLLRLLPYRWYFPLVRRSTGL